MLSYYADDVYYVKLQVIYVNLDGDITRIMHRTLLLSHPNCISSDELLQILKQYSYNHGKPQTLVSILKYNITLQPEDITQSVPNFDDTELTVESNMKSITFEQSINMFHDLNEITIIYREKESCLCSARNTRRKRPAVAVAGKFKQTRRNIV